MPNVDTTNKFLVTCGGRGIQILNPPLGGNLSADDALLFAAYLVALAEHAASHDFPEVLAAVQNA